MPADADAHRPRPKPGQGFVPDVRRAVMLLDVDGVVNSEGSSPWPDTKTTWPQVRTDWGASLCKVTTSKRIGEALLSLDVEIRWLTTWGRDANRRISPRAGLPQRLPVAATPPTHQPGSMGWKVETVVDTLRTGRRVIWVDDEADPALESDIRQRVPDGDLLVVWTTSATGITPADIETIRSYLSPDVRR